MNNNWKALAREAGIAAEHLASGITLLGKADCTRTGLYNQAFFDLCIGIERSTKLIFILDFYLKSACKFPPNKELKEIGHDLQNALNKTKEISELHNPTDKTGNLPASAIHKGIVEALSEFSKTTRYYNLDLLTGTAKKQTDPLAVWQEKVIDPALSAHMTEDKRRTIDGKANAVDARRESSTAVLFHKESGEEITTLEGINEWSELTKFAKPFIRMYVMQIIRFLASLLIQLAYKAQEMGMNNGKEDIPDFSDFFRNFRDTDKAFKARKKWSIYA